MDLLSIVAGAAATGAAYFLYLVATKGLPAAWAWVKAKWSAGATALGALQGDVAGAQTQIAALERRISTLEAAAKQPQASV